jgi:glycosyltransferase involved in cell wall biosynthesis
MGLIKLIRRERVDMIQSHLLGSNVYCSLAGLVTRKPVVATFHGTVDIGESERLKNIKFGAINLGARCIVAVSESLRQNIINRTPLSASKTTVIYNGIQASDFQHPHSDALRRQNGWAREDIIIGSLGNIRQAKGYDILLQAAALLKNKPVTFRFVIAGHGKPGLYDELQKLRNGLGLDGTVHFIGFNDDPAGFLSSLDLFLLPSISEGFSIATIQAMAASLPVIVTRSGGPEEIVTHGENGWIVEAGSPQAIADAIVLLSAREDLCACLAKKGKDHAVSVFDMSVMINSYQRLYDSFQVVHTGY